MGIVTMQRSREAGFDDASDLPMRAAECRHAIYGVARPRTDFVDVS